MATVTHLDHEERELEAFYLEHADHPEIKAMGASSASSSPAVRRAVLRVGPRRASPRSARAVHRERPGAGASRSSPGLRAAATGSEVAPVWR